MLYKAVSPVFLSFAITPWDDGTCGTQSEPQVQVRSPVPGTVPGTVWNKFWVCSARKEQDEQVLKQVWGELAICIHMPNVICKILQPRKSFCLLGTTNLVISRHAILQWNVACSLCDSTRKQHCATWGRFGWTVVETLSSDIKPQQMVAQSATYKTNSTLVKMALNALIIIQNPPHFCWTKTTNGFSGFNHCLCTLWISTTLPAARTPVPAFRPPGWIRCRTHWCRDAFWISRACPKGESRSSQSANNPWVSSPTPGRRRCSVALEVMLPHKIVFFGSVRESSLWSSSSSSSSSPSSPPTSSYNYTCAFFTNERSRNLPLQIPNKNVFIGKRMWHHWLQPWLLINTPTQQADGVSSWPIKDTND